MRRLIVSTLFAATSLVLASSVPALAEDDDGPSGMMMGQGCGMMGGGGQMGGGHRMMDDESGMMGGGHDRMGESGGMGGQDMMGQSGGMGSHHMKDGSGMMGGHHMAGKHGWRMEAAMQARLAYLRSELEITDAQADAWKGYADAVAAHAKAMQSMRKAVKEAMEKGPLERLDVRISGMETMLQSLKTVKPAAEKLYAALSDDQKKIADDVMGAGCGAM